MCCWQVGRLILTINKISFSACHSDFALVINTVPHKIIPLDRMEGNRQIKIFRFYIFICVWCVFHLKLMSNCEPRNSVVYASSFLLCLFLVFKQRFCLLVKTFMEFLSELEASLLALNHLFKVVKASFRQ